MPSECAPVPVPRDAVGHLGHARQSQIESHLNPRGGDGRSKNRAARLRAGRITIRGRRAAGRRLAVGPASPLLKLGITMLAGAARSSPGVVVRILVQGNLKCAVDVTEDVTASATVVTAGEVIEVLLAPGIIANRRLCVGL